MDKNILKLIDLSQENPDMEIITMTATEVCCDDSYRYWMGAISSVRKDYTYQPDEFVYCDEEDILNCISENLEAKEETDRLSDEEFEKEIEKEFSRLVKCGEIEEKIIIYIDV